MIFSDLPYKDLVGRRLFVFYKYEQSGSAWTSVEKYKVVHDINRQTHLAILKGQSNKGDTVIFSEFDPKTQVPAYIMSDKVIIDMSKVSKMRKLGGYNLIFNYGFENRSLSEITE